MKLSAEWKDRIVTAAIVFLSTVVAGVVLVHYEYICLRAIPTMAIQEHCYLLGEKAA